MNKRSKFLTYVVIVAVLATAATFLSVRSRKTAANGEIISLIVSSKKELAQLVTFKYYKDTVLYDTQADIITNLIPHTDTSAVYIARFTVRAGVNLDKLSEDDFQWRNDTLFVSIPAPTVLDISANPSDFRKIYASRLWDYDKRMSPLVGRAKAGIYADAVRHGVVRKAAASAEKSLGSFFNAICPAPVVVRCRLELPDESKH